jgi:hypothetical protein
MIAIFLQIFKKVYVVFKSSLSSRLLLVRCYIGKINKYYNIKLFISIDKKISDKYLALGIFDKMIKTKKYYLLFKG